MTKVLKNSMFSVVKSFGKLCSAPKDAVFEVEAAEPNYRLDSSDAVFTNPSQPAAPENSRKSACGFLKEEIGLPSLTIHKLHNAKIFPGKIRSRESNWHSSGQLVITSENGLFPESYGSMDGGHTLPSDLLVPDVSGDSYAITQSLPERHLKGNYLFLGSMHDHFGHFLVEGLSRLWILKYYSEEEISSLNILIYEPGLIPPATKILEYLGIKKSQIQFLTEPCTVESLIAPGIAYRTHFWARDVMNFVYDKIALAAIKERPTDFPKKIFLSRNNVPSRKLVSEVALESVYRDAGYWVIRPEDLPIGDQIRIAANADSIAGCTGSNMYLTMFQKNNAINHIYAPYDFTLKDDAMISQMRKSKLLYVLGSRLNQDQWTIDVTVASKILKDQL